MKRTRTVKKPNKSNRPANAILTADLHLTSKIPISRIDDYFQAQANKLRFLWELSMENNNCPILCAGDVFDHWKASPWLCSWAYRHLPKNMIAIPGNHDLPMHSMEEYDKSALFLLEIVGGLTVLKNESILIPGDIEIVGLSFGGYESSMIGSYFGKDAHRKILLIHEMVWPGSKKPVWAPNSYTVKDIFFEAEGEVDLIVSGDNHQAFTAEMDGCLLVNPGSMLRRTADQADFTPVCYLYFADDNTVESVFYPIEKGVHNIDHLTEKKDRDARITAYIERINDNWEGGLSFQQNLRAFFEQNEIPRKVRELIWQYLEGETASRT